jgi:hypothetical protein
MRQLILAQAEKLENEADCIERGEKKAIQPN